MEMAGTLAHLTRTLKHNSSNNFRRSKLPSQVILMVITSLNYPILLYLLIFITGNEQMTVQTSSNVAFSIQNIPGLGNVQVIPAASLQALTGGQTISSVTQQAQSVLPPGTQIIGSHYLFLYLNFKFIQLFYLYSCFFSWATTPTRS